MNLPQLATHSRTKIPMAISMISAGIASEMVDDYQLVDVNEMITRGREGFLVFEVTGDSMVDHIHPGNIVFVDSWAEPQNGDIVASDVNGATCVKIFQRKTNGLFLISANKSYEPREVTHADIFRILGVVRGHLAIYH